MIPFEDIAGEQVWSAVQSYGYTETATEYGFEPTWKLWQYLQAYGPEDFRLDCEKALVMLEAWGSTSHPSEPWERWLNVERNYAPEWLDKDDLQGADPDDCMTILDYSLSEPEAPEGWRLVYQYAAGEKECPWCGDGTGNEDTRADCKLCEGDGLLYQGEECQVCVFAPALRPKHWISGSGLAGCLYDNGPNVHDSKEDAIESILFNFDCLGKCSTARLKKDLEDHNIHYFDRRIRPFAGASYAEISECDCGGTDHPEGEDSY